MDSTNLSAPMIAELGAVFTAALTAAGPQLLQADLDGIEQALQALSRQVLGRVVEAVVATRVAQAPVARPECPECGQAMRRVARRPRQLVGLVGDYTLRRPYYVCDRCQRGRAPLDEWLGLGRGSLSPGLGRVAGRLGIETSFGVTTTLLAETLQVRVPAETVRRLTEGVGAVAEAEAQGAIGRAQAGAVPPTGTLPTAAALLVEADGAMVHLDDDWHEVKVGLAAPLGPATQTDPDTHRTRLVVGTPAYCAGLEPAEAFWYRLYVTACRQGLGSPALALVVVLGDGAEWIWHYAARFLAIGAVEVVEIVDLYHAWEHLGTVAQAVFGAGSAASTAWLTPLKAALRDQGVAPVLAALQALAPAEPTAADEVRKALGYFTTHADRMDYPGFVARGLPIGSGAVESGCKTLLEAREKAAGMRWSRTGAQAVATLRAVARSGGWEPFWTTRPQCRRPAVFPRHPRPVPGARDVSPRAA